MAVKVIGNIYSCDLCGKSIKGIKYPTDKFVRLTIGSKINDEQHEHYLDLCNKCFDTEKFTSNRTDIDVFKFFKSFFRNQK